MYLLRVCKAIVIDGHIKGTRSVCCATEVKTIYSEELGSIQMGFWKMPMKGSLYCTEHKHVKEEHKKVITNTCICNITLIYIYLYIHTYIKKVIKYERFRY